MYNLLIPQGTGGGGGGTTSPLTTKGDIWGYSSTNARVPVGSDNQILIADSAQTLGVKWALLTNASMANMANNTIKGNVSGGAAAPSDLTQSQIATFLAGGGFLLNRTTVSDVAYNVLGTDVIVAYTSLSTSRAVNVNPATTATKQILVVKDESGSCSSTNTLVVTPTSGTIDGAASISIKVAYGALRLYSNGTNLFTF